MANLTKDSQEKLSLMNGCEVRSVWNYEGVVYIKKNQVWMDGEKIDTLDTEEKIQDLFKEYFENEFEEYDFM